jgi:itaconate CoA-transferase
MGPVPAVGAHTDAILAELGYDAAAIARLRSAHAI